MHLSTGGGSRVEARPASFPCPIHALCGAMSGSLRARLGNVWRLVAESLSGRLLLLTLFYVLLTEAVIFSPSVGRYHHGLLQSHIESAEIAILPLTQAAGEKLSTNLREQLLARAGANAVVLRRPEG